MTKLKIFGIFTLLTALCISFAPKPVNASAFNPNNLMDDGIFYNTNTMNIAQIDNFLNTFPRSCISPNSGFSAPDPTGYNPTNGYLYGSNVSAGQVIYDAAQAYGLNPQVLLTTLEKEEGLVDGTGLYGCSALAISASVGYGCPDGGASYNYNGVDLYSTGTTFDSNFNVTKNGTEVTSISGTCVNSAAKVGFSQQIIHATWLLRFGQERSRGNMGWDVQKTNSPQQGDSWDNSDDPQSCYSGPMTQGTWQICPSGSTSYYDGYTTIDGTSVHIGSGATAALYWYTPHFSGNQNFDNIFTSWFGGIYAASYYAAYSSQSAYPQLNPGQQTTVFISYQNLGSQSWYDDTSITGAPAGTYPVQLATANPINRTSNFSAGWPSSNRPTDNFAAVYESDGTTLAANQHVVQPGQIAKFSFSLTDPSSLLATTYQEYFQPIADGSTWGLFNDPHTYLDVAINPAPSLSLKSQSANPTIAPSLSNEANLELQNNGNVPLYDDVSIKSAPAGTYPVHLATANPINSASDFSASWPSVSRADYTFAAVYESDGTTLAANQHVAQPGQVIKFAFDLTAPEQYANGTYIQYLQPILEGTPTGGFSSLGINWTITVPQTPVASYIQLPSPSSLVSNEPGQVTFQIKNVGNATLLGTSQIYTDNGGGFQAPSWQSSNIAETIGTDITVGQSQSITMPVLAPALPGNYIMDLSLVNNGTSTELPGSANIWNVNISQSATTARYISQSPYPSQTYDTANTIFISYINSGNQPWYDDSSINSASWRNPELIHLATAQPLNRCSGFDDQWPSCNRPTDNFAAVYESDGTTLAANQHVVQPGQIAKFSFQVQPAAWVSPATYREYFQPIVEGTPYGNFNFVGTYEDLTVIAPKYSASYSSESSFASLAQGSTTNIYFRLQNTGNVNWFDNTSVPPGRYATHLATSMPINRISQFSATWPSSNRPTDNFAAVYESDGTTLAANQHVVQPGQIAEFDFTATANVGPGQYQEYFQPILEGAPNNNWDMGGLVWTQLTIH